MYPIHFFESIASTNITAREFAEKGAVHGTAVIATQQTAGRGRLGKDWYSVPGKGLYCSLIVRPNLSLHDFPKITLVAGLGAAEAIDSIAGGFVQLKWPNDIFLDGKKCGGILTESSAMNGPEEQRFAIVGIGLNLCSTREDFPTDLRDRITSIFLHSGNCPKALSVFLVVRERILHLLEQFEKGGFQSILAAWKLRDFLFGKEMECVGVTGKVIAGVSLGPDEEGLLHVKSKDGKVLTVLSGDVRLAEKTQRNR